MKFLLSMAVVASAAMSVGCGSGGKTLEEGKVVTAQELAAIEQDLSNDGKRFAVEGYLCAPETMDEAHGEAVPMEVRTAPGGEGEAICTIQLRHDIRRNSFYMLDSSYTDEDIVIKDNENQKHPYDQKARYSFTANKKSDAWEFVDVRIDVVK